MAETLIFKKYMSPVGRNASQLQRLIGQEHPHTNDTITQTGSPNMLRSVNYVKMTIIANINFYHMYCQTKYSKQSNLEIVNN